VSTCHPQLQCESHWNITCFCVMYVLNKSSYKIHKARKFCDLQLYGEYHGQTEPHTYSVRDKVRTISVGTWTFRITRTGPQKIQCLFTKRHYIVLRSVCGVLLSATGNIIHEAPLHCIKVSVWCAVSATGNIIH